MSPRYRQSIAALSVTAVLAAGCAGPQDTVGSPPLTSSPVPSGGASAAPDRLTPRPPTIPPRKPTDSRPDGVVAGRINRGGPGPCYGLITDDGTQYALYGGHKGTFAVGTHVRVTVTRLLLRINCGAGIPAAIVEISKVG